MSGDLRTMLREATAEPSHEIDVDGVRRRAGALRARRVTAFGTAAVVLAVVTSLAVVMTTMHESGSDRARAGPSNGVYRDPATSGVLQLPVPSGWHHVHGDVFASALPGRDEVAVATFAFDSRVDRACDVPVSALDALGPSDAVVAAHVVANGTGYGRRPPAAEFVPTQPPESGYATCLHRATDFDMAVNGFVAEGRTVEVFTALGKQASPATRAALLRAVEGLRVEALHR